MRVTRERLATLSASIGAGLVFATAGFHLSGYKSVVSRMPVEQQPLVAALWVAAGLSLGIAALLAVAVTPLFVVRRRALLYLAALTPLSIAALQLAYLGFLAPTALLLLDAIVLAAAGELGRACQPAPSPLA